MPELPFVDAKVHSELATESLMRGFNVDELFQRGVRFNVAVSGGLMDGLQADIHARRCTIGAALDSDIVLFDDGVDAWAKLLECLSVILRCRFELVFGKPTRGSRG